MDGNGKLARAILEIVEAHFEHHARPGAGDAGAITRATKFADLDADNLDAVEILMDIDERLGADLSHLDDAITRDSTVGDLISAIELALADRT